MAVMAAKLVDTIYFVHEIPTDVGAFSKPIYVQ